MKKQLLTLLTLLFCVALSAQTVDVRVCQTDKFIAGCTVYDRADGNQTGIPVDLGDKSYTLNLSWGTPATFAYTDSFAVGGNYLFGCQTLTTAGTYYDTLTTSTGCDSIVTLTLTEYTPVPPCEEVTFAYTDSMATGGTYIFQCQVLTEAGEYRDTLVKADGCDSIIVLTLKEYTVVIQNDTLRDTIAVNLCYNEPFTDYLGVTYYPTQDTVVLDTVMISRDTIPTLIHTVDSIFRYELTVQQPKDSTTTATICAGESFSWFGNDYSVEDTYYDTLRYTTGCDSICGTLILTVQQPKDSTTTVTICAGESFSWFGNDYSVEDTYYDTLRYTTGCDSICGTLVLTVQSRYVDELPALVKDDSWLLMIHRRSIREDYGIDFTADQVHWYRVEGEVDEYPYGEDNDVQVGTGDYYTIAQKMSGKYYALLDVDVSWLNACALFARTVILDCDNPSGPMLSPTIVAAGGLMKLTNLKEGELTLSVYTPAGQKVRTESVKVDNEYDVYAERVSGVYLLQITNGGKTNVFKYVVTQ